MSYFTRNDAITESEVLAKKVVVPKDKRGITSSREFGIHYSKATGALNQVFGAARNFVPTIWEGETDQPYHNIQEMYVGNLQNLKGVKNIITKYNMVDPFNILVMINLETENTAFQWGDETTNREILVHWSQVDITEAIKYERDTNKYISEEDMTSSDWFKDLIINTSEA